MKTQRNNQANVAISILAGVMIVVAMVLGMWGPERVQAVPRPSISAPGPVIETSENGYQVIEWDWIANSAGAATAQTVQGYYGMLFSAHLSPDPLNPIAHATTILVKERHEYGTWSDAGSDAAGGLITHNTGTLKTVAFWPTARRPVSGKLQFELSGAENAGHTGASGKCVLVVAPYPSQ